MDEAKRGTKSHAENGGMAHTVEAAIRSGEGGVRGIGSLPPVSIVASPFPLDAILLREFLVGRADSIALLASDLFEAMFGAQGFWEAPAIELSYDLDSKIGIGRGTSLA
jgi:hypothetical protein